MTGFVSYFKKNKEVAMGSILEAVSSVFAKKLRSAMASIKEGRVSKSKKLILMKLDEKIAAP